MTSESIASLIAGARAWCAGAAPARDTETAAVVIAAADSPVDPAALCGAAPGALYVVRTPGALVPPAGAAAEEPADLAVAAALEYGVMLAGAREIVVLGHAGCGLLAALADEAGERALRLARTQALRIWAAQAAPALARAAQSGAHAPARRRLAAMELVRLSLENLMSYPWLLERVLAGEVALHGWCLDAAPPSLWVLDPEADEFRRA